MKETLLFLFLLCPTLAHAEISGRIDFQQEYIVRDIRSDMPCSGYLNGGKLTTDSQGNIICADDVSYTPETPPPEPPPEPPPTEKIIYFDPSGDDSKDGKSCQSAVKTTQRASEIAACGDVIQSCGGQYKDDQTIIGKNCSENEQLTIKNLNINCSSGTCFHGVNSSFLVFDNLTARGNYKAIGARFGDDNPNRYKNGSTHDITLLNSDIGETAHWGLAFSQHLTHPAYNFLVKNTKVHDVTGSLTEESSSNGHCIKLTSWGGGGDGYKGNGWGVKFDHVDVINCDRTGIQASNDWNDVEIAHSTCHDASRLRVYGSPCFSIGDDTHTKGSIHDSYCSSDIGKQWCVNVDRGASNIEVSNMEGDKNYIGIIAGLNKSPEGKNVTNLRLINNKFTNTIDRQYVQRYADGVYREGNSFDADYQAR